MAFDTKYYDTNRFTTVQFTGGLGTTAANSNSMSPFSPFNGDNVGRVRCEGFIRHITPIPQGNIYSSILSINLTEDLNTTAIRFRLTFRFGSTSNPDVISAYLVCARRGTILGPNTITAIQNPTTTLQLPLWTTNLSQILSIDALETTLSLSLPFLSRLESL